MNWLIVGTGDIATKRVMPALDSEPRCTIAAVCDISSQRAAQAAAPHRAAIFTDYEKALAQPSIDAVYVATPVFVHTAQAIAALQAGKHVIVEKPVGVNHAQAQQLVSVARKSNQKCAAAYFRRFYPRYQMAAQMLAAGTFGQVVLIRMTYFSWFNPDGNDPKYWRVVPQKSGGGPLADVGSHMFDVMIGLLGLPDRVFAKTETLTHDYQAEDSAVVIMKYDSGPQVIASFNWNSKTWSHEFEIIGAEAKVKWHPYDGPTILKTVGRNIETIEAPNSQNVHLPLIADFVDCVQNDTEPPTSPAQAAKTNLLLDAIYLSSKLGREVTVQEASS